MNNTGQIVFLLVIATAIIAGCRKPYTPPVVAADNNYLVVEGLINSGPDSTFFKLSRTVKLSSSAAPKPELNAVVTVESDQGSSYPLQEAGNGEYVSPPLNLDNTRKYRLRIKTTANKEYLSDFIQAKNTPDIDSISYKVQNNGIQFYVNSHDQSNNTRYYRWDFDETWKYVSIGGLNPHYLSNWKYEYGQPPIFRLPSNPGDNILECYYTDQSHQVLLGSTAKLDKDVLSKYPIDFVDAPSGKISIGYSVLLRQYALTVDGFNYWQELKKNTEQLGFIFDAQPSSSQGNIHCVSNPNEPVIGYVSASSVKTKRIFIDHFNINLYVPIYLGEPDLGACPIKYISIAPDESFQFRLDQALASRDSTLTLGESLPGGIIIGYHYAPTECVDCRAKSPFGTNTKPVYWPY